MKKIASQFLIIMSMISFLLTACAAGPDKNGGALSGAGAAEGQETTGAAAEVQTGPDHLAAGKESTGGDPVVTMEETADEGSLSRGSEYILPEVSTRLYTQEELEHLTAGQMKLARNEIYARHGRKFKDQSLQTYFKGKSWYHGTVEPDQFKDSLLNQPEQDNLELLTRLEDEALHGRTGYPIPPYAKAFAEWDGQHQEQKISGDLYHDGTGSVNSTNRSVLIKHDKYYEITDCRVQAQGVFERSLFDGKEAGDTVNLYDTNYKIRSITVGKDGFREIELDDTSIADPENSADGIIDAIECSAGFYTKGEDNTGGPWTDIYEGSVYFYRDARIVTGMLNGEKTITAKEYFETPAPGREEDPDADPYYLIRGGGLIGESGISLMGIPSYDQNYYFTGFTEASTYWVG